MSGLSNTAFGGSGSDFDTGDRTRLAVVETLDSRTISFDRGTVRGSRKFIVYVNGAGQRALTAQQAIDKCGVAQGDVYPDNSDLVAESITSRPLERMGRLGYLVEVGYTSTALQGVSAPPGPSDPEFQDIGLSGEAFFLDVYREPGPNQPFVVPASEPAGTGDIGGNPVDFAGRPAQRLVRNGRYQITRNLPLDLFNDYTLLAAVGARNDRPFRNWPAGSLLYGRPNASKIEANVVRVTHSLILDEFFHLRQKAELQADGSPRLNDAGRAAFVEWYQPFPRLVDFGTLRIFP